MVSSAAKMPSSCRGKYRRVAVVRRRLPLPVKLIAERGNVLNIVWERDRLHAGSESPRTAFGKALSEAEGVMRATWLKEA